MEQVGLCALFQDSLTTTLPGLTAHGLSELAGEWGTVILTPKTHS